MKLHLPIPLRAVLLSALISFVGFSSGAQVKVIGGCYSLSSGSVQSDGDILWSDYDRLIFCYNESASYGGCFYSNHYSGAGSELFDINCLYFHHNKASAGGSIYAYWSQGLKIHDCSRVYFESNTATGELGGGAIYSGCTIYKVENLTFDSNRSTAGCGGAISCGGAPIRIQYCDSVSFKHNFAYFLTNHGLFLI